ncbi:MAG: hypothetical protein P3W94_001730 [Paracoccus sp. (in: a-proteobacteria)]|nr:hypothetical protein [Paracoccus sp. (in: a-proteobacteria)]
MLIFWKQRVVFLANPKTGSTSLEMALEPLAEIAFQRPRAMKHTAFPAYRRFLAPWLQEQAGEPFTTVALMRDPLDWLRSWYRFTLQEPEPEFAPRSFTEFALAYADGAPETQQIGTQSAFLGDGTAQVDRLFRYDDMASFVEFLETRLDCVIELPRLNVPPSVDVSLDPQAIPALRRALCQDQALYDSLGQGVS